MERRYDNTDKRQTADLPGDHEGPAGADPSGHGGVRSRSSVGSEGYGGQPGMGGFEQGFQNGPEAHGGYPGQPGQAADAPLHDPDQARWRTEQTERFEGEYRDFRESRPEQAAEESDQWLHGRAADGAIDDGSGDPRQNGTRGARPGPDGLGAITSSTESGDGTNVAAGRIVRDAGSVDFPSRL